MADEKVYVIVGSGFTPGLPARVTMREAEEMGVKKLLEDAIASGLYAEERPSTASGKKPLSAQDEDKKE